MAIAARDELLHRIYTHPDRMQRARLANALERLVDEQGRKAKDPLAQVSFRDYIIRVKPNYQLARHNEVCIAALQRVADGELRRLMLQMPPRHGKTELARLFASYYLHRHPERMVGVTSYSDELARGISRTARGYYRMLHTEMVAEVAAAHRWQTGLGGEMWAAGMGGQITGFGVHLGFIDDPIKGEKAAASALVRDTHRDWYRGTFVTRFAPDAAVVIIQTRWNIDDLSGWLLLLEDEGVTEERWHVVCLPAIRDDYAMSWPEGVTVEEDWRAPGEALWPEHYPLEELLAQQRRFGGPESYLWQGLYQQRPPASSGHGRVCKQFDGKNLVDALDLLDGVPVMVGMDFNVDPMSLAFSQMAGGQVQFFKTLQLRNSDTEEACRTIRQMFPDRHIIVHPDPTGSARKTSAGGKTDFSIIESFGFELRSPSRPWAVSDRVNAMNRACGYDETKPPCLVIASNGACSAGVASLTNLTYKPGTAEIDKGTRGPGGVAYDHMFDAMSFTVTYELPVEGVPDEVIPMFL